MYAVCINCGEWLSGSPLSSLNRSPFPLNTVWVLFRNCLNCNSLRWSHIHFICLGTDVQSFSAGYLELPSLNLSYNLKFISLVQDRGSSFFFFDSKLSQLGHFLFYCPFKGGYFSSVDLEMGVHVRLQEVSACLLTGS